MVEQLLLFEDKYVLLNMGTSALAKLDLQGAKECLQRYGKIYKDNKAIDGKLKIADFLIAGLKTTATGPDESACLYSLWLSFEKYVKREGLESDATISKIKASFFQKLIDSIDRHNLSDHPFLSDNIPLGYVYLNAGLYDRAVASLQKSLLAAPGSASLYGYLGDAYLLKGEKAIARQCYFEACLINPDSIDWNHMKDDELSALRNQLMEAPDADGQSAASWLPCHAYLQGLFKPKAIRLKDELKRLVNEYLIMRKTYIKQKTPESEPQLFITAIVLCDNQSTLKLIKGIDFIEIRKTMKEINPMLFRRYLEFINKHR